tara:strand:- start:8549 stop:8869 length:321 start_codon:yes stop_codon:yes gene_type:complete
MTDKRTPAQVDKDIEDLKIQLGIMSEPRFARFRGMLQAKRMRIVTSDLRNLVPSNEGDVGRLQGKLEILDWIEAVPGRLGREIQKLEKEQERLMKATVRKKSSVSG